MASVTDDNKLHIEVGRTSMSIGTRSMVVDAQDMYSRDGTPVADDMRGLDGEQSLGAAIGWQRDGRTIVMFRRAIRGVSIGFIIRCP